MSTIIIYISKSGATKRCAEILAKNISGSVLCDIQKHIPLIDDFDTIIIGSGIRMGKIYKPMNKFIKKNLSLLMSKSTAIFLCNYYSETFLKAIENNIPKELSESVICIESLGGKKPFASNLDENTWIKQENMITFVHALEQYI